MKYFVKCKGIFLGNKLEMSHVEVIHYSKVVLGNVQCGTHTHYFVFFIWVNSLGVADLPPARTI